jgi:3-oxoacyl-(acyl-carrier-protein) synthase
MNSRVVITGVGIVSPLAQSLEHTRDALAAGRSAVAPITSFDASHFAITQGAELKEFDPRPSFSAPKALKMADRAAQLAVVAARAALDAAHWRGESPRPLGVLMGTSGHDLRLADIAGAIGRDDEKRALTDTVWAGTRIMDGLPPLWLVSVLPNMISAHVAMQMSALGPCSTVMSSDAAGVQAIGEAVDWIRSGEADAVLAGAADCAVYPFVLAAWTQAGLPRIPGEGAAVWMLERRDHAIARGAPILAEILAHGSAGAGRARCDRLVADLCAQGGVEPEHVGWTTGDVVRSGAHHVDWYDQLGDALAARVPIAATMALMAPMRETRTDAIIAVCGSTGPSAAVVVRGETRVEATA